MNKNAGMGRARGDRGVMGGMGGSGGSLASPPPMGPAELGPPVLTNDNPGPDGGNVPPHYPIDPIPPSRPPNYPGAPGNGGYPTSLEAKNKVRAGMGLDGLTPPTPKYGGM